MTTLDGTTRPTAARDTAPRGAGPGPAPIYLLKFYPPVGSPAPGDTGWRLEQWHGHQAGWSIALGDHGADATARPHVAQTAADRVMGDHDIGVSHWLTCGGDRPVMFLAHLRLADGAGTDSLHRSRAALAGASPVISMAPPSGFAVGGTSC